jgi:hypothetical protein
MYKIIGADHNEYGPSSADEIREWIKEGRADRRTLVKAEGSNEWKALASFPEFADALGISPPGVTTPNIPVDHSTLPPDIEHRDYELDITGCVSRGWKLVTANLWPVVGVTFLVTVCNGAINQFMGTFTRPAMREMMESGQIDPHTLWRVGGLVAAASLLAAPVQTLLYGGLFRYYLKLIRGETAEIGDAFSGFSLAFGPLILLGLVRTLLVFVGFGLCLLPGIYLSVAWTFAVPLLIDKRMGVWAALELSRKVVSRHWFEILGLVMLNGLVAAVGICGLCVGIFFTVPVALVSLMYAYEDIFGHRPGPRA